MRRDFVAAITAVHAAAMLIGIGPAGTTGGGAGILPIIAR